MSRINWHTRDQVSNQQEAVEAIADYMSSYDGVSASLGSHRKHDPQKTLRKLQEAVGSGAAPDDIAKMIEASKHPLDEVEDFAKKWSVPFNRELTVSILNKIDDKHNSDDGYWSPSSYSC